MRKVIVICEPSLLLMQTVSGEKFVVYPNSKRYCVIGDKQRFQQCLMQDLHSPIPRDIICANNIISIMESFSEIEGEV
jgi:hypothetical protein